jgi:hypothetical protein
MKNAKQRKTTQEVIVVADFEVSGGGTVYLITALNSGAQSFLEEHLAEDALRFGSGFAVEHRYIMDLVVSLRTEGFVVR